MAVFRIEKTRDYTVMSNHHLRDKSLSLKAKGLLSLMLSLPEEWDYTTKGLARICKDGVDSICAGVRELEEHGYVIRQRVRNPNGQLGAIEYTILEQPRPPEPKPQKPERENPVLDNPEQASAFQCGNYRNQNNECVSHFIKTSALEAAILQAIKAVSQYVIENEAEFISQLKTVWNESKSKSANNGQQEIDEAKKRMAELDAKIQKLYDSAISGLLPERQAQRMIQQYDEEQLMLPISPKWKKRNAYSVKSYWKRNANGQNEPTGKRIWN